MKTFAIAAAATLLAGSAFAQDSRPSPRDQMPTSPSFQQGSGAHRAGGPARELNSETGRPATTGTVVVPQGGAVTVPMNPQATGAPPAGKGHTAGGPLGEQMRRQGVQQ
jgi:hypothetical protein